MDVAGPVLSHIAEIASHAEETVRSITHDMDMSTVAYLARRSLGNSPKSLVDLYHLNNLFVHVVEFATSDTVVGYLDGVASDRLEAACNSMGALASRTTQITPDRSCVATNPTAKITILAGTSLSTGILSVIYRFFLSDSKKVIMFLPLLPAALVFLLVISEIVLVQTSFSSIGASCTPPQLLSHLKGIGNKDARVQLIWINVGGSFGVGWALAAGSEEQKPVSSRSLWGKTKYSFA
ncbi:hypothetical protein F5882DRAFT_439598 [Hyaloscypha sp. PMI_1271]|nr:hypothetical protein F5882DRAFT_439598 [Hyaloscypha sp. PMI_1271]